VIRRKNNTIIQKLILRMLADGAMTSYQIADKLGLTVRNTRPYLEVLLKEEAVVVIDFFIGKPGKPGPKIPIFDIPREGISCLPLSQMKPVLRSGKVGVSKLSKLEAKK
jgi:predicted ArsR family transcriptional regulator